MGDVLADTACGKIRGIVNFDYKNGAYCSFFGIPYGKPPLGELRFKAPQTQEKWYDIKDCTQVKDGCVSRHMLTAKIIGSEDCLYLNVYTKKLPSDGIKPRPVMVWVHGGGYACGSGNPDLFDPQFLITQDVVIVAMSYRVGPLGFLCLEEESLDVPGNAGIKDVLLALRWVKNNIHHFNGDPNNVTLGGQSSGAMLSSLLMLTPLAKGLFHRAILQSGSAIHNGTLGQRKGAKELAKVLGFDSENERDVLKFLREVAAVDMLRASQKVQTKKIEMYMDTIPVFTPVIETRHPGAVITEHPIATILKGNYTKVPLIMGYTNEEGLYMMFIVRNMKVILEDFERMVPHTLQLEKGSPESKRMAKKIKQFFFGDKEATAENVPLYIKMATSSFFSYSVHRNARLFAQNLGHPLYFYRFSVDADLNVYKHLKKHKAPGASHSDDTCYLFNTMLTPKIREGSLEERVITRMVTLWGNFIKNGNPNSSQDEVKDVDWKPIQGRIFNFVDITNDGCIPSMDPDEKVMHFWDDIYKTDPRFSYHKL